MTTTNDSTTDPTTLVVGLRSPLVEPRHRQALADFVTDQAERAAKEIGFGWRGTPHAPSTYQQLRGAYVHSLDAGEPLPISNEHCESSVYPAPEANVAFRFWHDVSHVRRGLSFNLEDELELALWHLTELRGAGYDPQSPVHQLMEYDLVGQVLLMGLIGRFPLDQGRFVATCAQAGLLGGLLDEVRRVP